MEYQQRQADDYRRQKERILSGAQRYKDKADDANRQIERLLRDRDYAQRNYERELERESRNR
jgi:nitrogen fixation-related uncharacterized protein